MYIKQDVAVMGGGYNSDREQKKLSAAGLWCAILSLALAAALWILVLTQRYWHLSWFQLVRIVNFHPPRHLQGTVKHLPMLEWSPVSVGIMYGVALLAIASFLLSTIVSYRYNTLTKSRERVNILSQSLTLLSVLLLLALYFGVSTRNIKIKEALKLVGDNPALREPLLVMLRQPAQVKVIEGD